jgi:hypothetical protein
MFEKYKNLLPALILSYLGSLIIAWIFPWIRPIGYVGALVLTISRFPLSYALWISAGIGLLIDISSASIPFGFFAINYSLSTLIIFRYRKFFSEEKIEIFPLYAILFSFTSTSIHFILYGLIDLQLKLRLFTILTDLLLMPIFDGVYAFLFVFGPLSLYHHLLTKKQILLYRRIYKKIKNRIKGNLWTIKRKLS